MQDFTRSMTMRKMILAFLFISFAYTGTQVRAEPTSATSQQSEQTIVENLLMQQRQRVRNAIDQNNIGLRSYNEAIKKAAEQDATVKKIMNVISTDQVTFAMDRDPKMRLAHIKTGFLNIYQTGKSAGANR